MENYSKLNDKMSIEEAIMTMCDGNIGALNVVMRMVSDVDCMNYIFLCDSLGIRGEVLYMLLNDCCDNNFEKFKRTLQIIESGVFSREQIYSNFSLCKALPFVDDSTLVDGVPPYGQPFDSSNPKWREYCAKNKGIFEQKLQQRIDELNKIAEEMKNKNAGKKFE